MSPGFLVLSSVDTGSPVLFLGKSIRTGVAGSLWEAG
jgi:hypothetical protein